MKQARIVDNNSQTNAAISLAAHSDIDVTPLLFTSDTPITHTKALELMNSAELDNLKVVNTDGALINTFSREQINNTIMLSTPELNGLEASFIQEALESNWLAPGGPQVALFEKEMQDYLNVNAAIATASGTAALHLALRVLGVGRDDVVFCSSLTFVASANPILYVGAKPVFIDSAPNQWNISAKALERALVDAKSNGCLPKAVIIVNLFGYSAEYDKLLSLCEQYKVPVIEDAAESLGARYNKKASGTLGRLGVFSFNGNKMITAAGGGMLVSDDVELIEQAKYLAGQAKGNTLQYEHEDVGYNYRMSHINAAIARAQFQSLDDHIKARRIIFQRYYDALSEHPEFTFLSEPAHSKSCHWLSVLLYQGSGNDNASHLLQYLSDNDIEARPVWKPMHQQHIYRDAPFYSHHEGSAVSYADRYCEEGICLPSSTHLTIQQQTRVIDVLKDIGVK